MDNKDFYLEGAHLAYRNALAHYKAAKLLSSRVNYGIANSHLILSAEEAIKAFVLIRKYSGDNITEEKLKPFFSKHTYKQDFLKKALRKVDPMHIIYRYLLSAMGDTEVLKNLEKQHGIKVTPKEMRSKAKERMASFDGSEEHKKIGHWLDEANDIKNTGFYVGLSQSKTQWVVPAAVSKEQYEESEKIVNSIIDYYLGTWIKLYSVNKKA